MLSGNKQPIIGVNNNILLVQPLKVLCTDEERAKWSADHALPQSLLDCSASMENSIKSVVVYIIANKGTQSKREDVFNIINARLTSLEGYVGGNYETFIENYPTISIAIKEMLANIAVHMARIHRAIRNAKTHKEDVLHLQ
eukprot:15211294-Ditylum_brightwellii.AAC.1